MESRQDQQFCAQCGFNNPISAPQCRNCGAQLLSPDERTQLWSTRQQGSQHGQGAPGSEQPTQTGWGRPPDDAWRPSGTDVTTAGGANWAAASRGAPPPSQPGQAGPVGYGPPGAGPTHTPPTLPPPRRRGPPGCVMGCAGLVLILAVAVVAVVLSVPNFAVRGELRDQVREVVATEVARIDELPVAESGEITVTETDINRELRRYTTQFGPVGEPSVVISSDDLELSFRVFGIRSGYRGELIAQDGRVRLTNAESFGIAGQILPTGDVVVIVEDLFDDLLTRSDLAATEVRSGAGLLTIVTVPAGTAPDATPGTTDPITAPTQPEAPIGQPPAVATEPAEATAPPGGPGGLGPMLRPTRTPTPEG